MTGIEKGSGSVKVDYVCDRNKMQLSTLWEIQDFKEFLREYCLINYMT